MKKILAGMLIIGVFAIGAFGLWLMACGSGPTSQFCETMSMLCAKQICPMGANNFFSSSFHIESFVSLLLAVFLSGFAAFAAVMFFDLFWRPRLHARFRFEAVFVHVPASARRLLHWFALQEKRDPAV